MDIAIVDSGGANLASVLFALERIGARATLTRDPEVIFRAPRVLLPGVGAAASCMRTLHERELISCLRELRQPALGICLGMQLLFESSEEGGNIDCLGLIPGRVSALVPAPERPVPHMGWNRVEGECAIYPKAESGSHFYFVHSFAAPSGAAVRATSDYGVAVPAIVEWKNWFGVQFHPERSGLPGEKLLRRFLEGV